MADPAPLTDLQKRLAALRKPPSAVHKPTPTQTLPIADAPPSDDDDDDDEDLAAVLSSLDPPAEGQHDLDVPIETKNVDTEMTAFLASAASQPPRLPSPPPDHKLNAALSSYESLLPALSPIQVFHAAPPPTSSRSLDDEEALMARLRDELSLETAHKAQDDEQAGGWEKRLAGLQGVVAGPTKVRDLTGGLGAPPAAVEVGELKEEARGSDESSAEERTSESSAEEDSEED